MAHMNWLCTNRCIERIDHIVPSNNDSLREHYPDSNSVMDINSSG